jgi:hypothetical protein
MSELAHLWRTWKWRVVIMSEVCIYKLSVSFIQAVFVRYLKIFIIFLTCYGNLWPRLWSSGQSSWLQNGDALCFLWGTNWIYIFCVEESRPPPWSSGQSSWLQNGDVLCFLWGTNWIYVCYIEESRPPLWSSGQSSWIQIQKSGFDSQRYQSFWKVLNLERGPHSLVSTNEELLERKSSSSGLEIREYCRRDPSRWPRVTLYPQKLAVTSPTSGSRSVGIVRSRTQATEFFLMVIYNWCIQLQNRTRYFEMNLTQWQCITRFLYTARVY